MTNLRASDFKFPPLIPAGDYRADMRVYNNKNQTIIFPRIYINVKSKGLHDLAMGWVLFLKIDYKNSLNKLTALKKIV